MGKIVGRSDDMLIIRGVNLFPTQIEEIILSNPKLSGQYQLIVTRDGHLDQIEVRCELQPAAASGGEGLQRELADWLRHRIKTLVGLSAKVSVSAPGSLERTLTGKAKRVFDQRPKG